MAAMARQNGGEQSVNQEQNGQHNEVQDTKRRFLPLPMIEFPELGSQMLLRLESHPSALRPWAAANSEFKP